MKPTFARRRRRPSTTDIASYKKENQQEQQFFGEVSHEPFFKSATTMQQNAPVHRKCADCEKEDKVQRMPEKKEEEKVMKKEDNKEEEKIQKKEAAAATSATASNYISSINSKGQNMNVEVQSFYENRMGADFSDVKIHTDKEAAESAKDVNAQAYAYGNHIVFNEGKYSPESSEGKKLLAHELAHVVQQGSKSFKRKNLFRKADFVSTAPVYDVNLAEQFVDTFKGSVNGEFGSTHPLINSQDLTVASANPIKIPAESDLSTVAVGNDFESSVTTIPLNETSFHMRLPQKGLPKWTQSVAVSDIANLFQNFTCTITNTNIEVTGSPSNADIITDTQTHENVHASHIKDCHTDYIVKFDQFLSTRKSKAATAADSKKNLLTTIRGMAAAMWDGFVRAFNKKAITFHSGKSGRKGNLAITNITKNCSKVEVRATN